MDHSPSSTPTPAYSQLYPTRGFGPFECASEHGRGRCRGWIEGSGTKLNGVFAVYRASVSPLVDIPVGNDSFVFYHSTPTLDVVIHNNTSHPYTESLLPHLHHKRHCSSTDRTEPSGRHSINTNRNHFTGAKSTAWFYSQDTMINDGTSHRIFRISELTRVIASHLVLISQGSAVNLACAYRYLEEPVLSTLWETQSSLYTLLEVLPKDTWGRWGGLAHHAIVVCNPNIPS